MSKKIVLDAEKVNEMRMSMTDLEIRKALCTSTVNINLQCGTRKKNNIPFVQRNKGKKTGIPMPEKKKEITSGLLTTKHEVKLEVPYWDTSNLIEVGTKPLEAFYDKLTK